MLKEMKENAIIINMVVHYRNVMTYWIKISKKEQYMYADAASKQGLICNT